MFQHLKNKCSSTSLSYTFYTHTHQIPIAIWNTINTSSNIFLSIPYLQTLENTLASTIAFKYIIFYEKETPVAIAVTQMIKFDPNTLKFNEFPCTISHTIKKLLLKNMEVKVLVCGNLFSCGEHGFVYTDAITPQKAFNSLHEALHTLHKTETEDKPSFILLKEFWPTSFKKSDYIKQREFKEFMADVNMVVPIAAHWDTFEDYLSSMKTKFRSRAKKVFKKAAPLTLREFTPQDIANHSTTIDALYLSVIDKAAFKIGKLNAATFQKLKSSLHDQFLFNAYFLEEKLVGFTTAFVLDTIVEANHIGIDYTYNKSYAIYQKMLYDYVAIAITHKVSELRLGRTAEIIKSTVGARPVAMKLYVRHRNLISNTILTPLIELISPSEYEIRNPFKLQLQ